MPGLCDLPGAHAVCNKVGGAVDNAIQGAAGSAVGALAQAFQEAQVKILGTMMTFWTDVKTPTLSNEVGPVKFLHDYTSWFVGYLAVFGLVVAAGKLAWQRRVEPARQAAEGLLTLAVVTGAGVGTVTLLTKAGDAYSKWIISRAIGSDFSGAVTDAASLAGTLAPGLMIIVAFFAILSCLFQIAMMLVRVAMLGLLTGTLAIGAAVATTEDGKAWFKKMCGWLLAFVLYKPVAATVYAYGLKAMGTPESELAQLVGIITIVLAAVALPALMRFITPMVSASTVGGGGGGVAAAGAAVATGARMIPGIRGGGAATPSGGGNAPAGRWPGATPAGSPLAGTSAKTAGGRGRPGPGEDPSRQECPGGRPPSGGGASPAQPMPAAAAAGGHRAGETATGTSARGAAGSGVSGAGPDKGAAAGATPAGGTASGAGGLGAGGHPAGVAGGTGIQAAEGAAGRASHTAGTTEGNGGGPSGSR